MTLNNIPDESTLNAEQIAVDVQQGCVRDFEKLVKIFRPRLYAFLLPKVANTQDAEDLVQDTFIRAFCNIDKYDTRWKFSTWIFTIADRLAKSHYRKNIRQRAYNICPQPSCEQNDPHRTLSDKENEQKIWNLANDLAPDQYQALWLRYCQSMTVKEIAKVLDKTQVNVKVILYRARLNMAKKLARENIFPESEGE